ncbi:hypothetical protein IAR55_005122 [Kwoniella newhampshirensis]|uniref:Uncharacterized protein n=1 Tax=Kwoniella newhampshirensis TaxID=1651941 RepID=A0AAW0YMP9_9TREE
MPSSLLSRPNVEPSSTINPINQTFATNSTQRQSRLKSISSLFHHPFSNANANANANANCDVQASSLSHVIPYRQPSNLDNAPAKSSFQNEAFELRRQTAIGSTTSLPLRPTTTRSIHSEIGTSTPFSSMCAGSPAPRSPGISGAGVSYTGHSLQAQVKRDSASLEPLPMPMPTLASAIHIPDAVPIAPTISPRTISRATFHHHHDRERSNATMRSLFESHAVAVAAAAGVAVVDRDSRAHGLREIDDRGSRGRSDSRASNNSSSRPSESRTRTMSRRLSLDNILPKLTGSLRKKPSKNDTSGNDRRWSLISRSESKGVVVETNPTFSAGGDEDHTSFNTTKQVRAAQTVNPMAMPSMRTWRNKFAVNNKDKDRGGATMGVVRAEAAVRQSHVQARETRVDSCDGTQRYEERTIRRVGAVRNGSGNRAITDRPSSVTSSLSYPNPAATPRSAPSPTQHHLTTASASTPATLDSPSPLPGPLHTPLGRGRTLKIAQIQTRTQTQEGRNSHIRNQAPSFLFSPAQDDKSIVDPERSPMPMTMFEVSPPVPAVPSVYRNRQRSPRTEEVGQTINEGDPQKGMSRHQSLSELKEAYHRLKDLSGVSGETSRSVSGTEGQHLGGLDRRNSHGTDLDLEKLDTGLRSAMNARPTSSSQSKSTNDSDVRASQSESLGNSHSNQSWHTATSSFETTPLPPLPASSSQQTLLPRSRSKSHTDLSTYSSSKNLLEHTEKTQGPGWWSADKRQTEIETRLNLASLKSHTCAIPHREKFNYDEVVDENDEEEIPVPARRFSSSMTRRYDEVRSKSTLDLRSSSRAHSRSYDTSCFSRSTTGVTHSKTFPSTNVSSSSSVSGSGMGQGPRLSLVAGSTWGRSDVGHSPRRTVLDRRSSLALALDSNCESEDINETTPERPRSTLAASSLLVSGQKNVSGIAKAGPFVSSRISPDIARRASWMVTSSQSRQGPSTQTQIQMQIGGVRSRYVENGSPTRSIARQTTLSTCTTAPTSLNSSTESDHEQDQLPSSLSQSSRRSAMDRQNTPGGGTKDKTSDLENKLSLMRSRHALELDAVLTALSLSKGETKALKEEISSLHQLLGKGVEERERLRGKVKVLEDCLVQIAGVQNHVEEDEGSLDRPATKTTTTTTATATFLEDPKCSLEVVYGAGAGMKRSDSVTSSLLPELTVADCPLRETTLTVNENDVDEFGRRVDISTGSTPRGRKQNLDLRPSHRVRPSVGKGREMKIRVVSNAGSETTTTSESNVLYDDEGRPEQNEIGGEGWTLRLREDDEAYLDDL